MKRSLLYVSICLIFLLAACSSANKTNPADATYSYLQALAEKNKTKIISLSCKSWEEQATLEVDALLSVGASLNNVVCKVTGTQGDFQLVSCTGKLDLTYDNENRAIDLSSRVYSMAMEDGQWRVCSYK
jgi:hypothetical protein